MYALVDCNNFYASCERLFRPELNGKPVCVLSNNDGCVIARSNEAKPFVPMGAPAFQYDEVFKKQGIHVFSANFELYGDLSNRVMNILAEFTNDVEIYSIDEIFLKLDGFDRYDLQKYGTQMKNKVWRWTGMPISVGIAPTKSLAKVANRIAKKFPTQTAGSYVIDTEEKRLKALKWLNVEDVWGIGRQHARRLNKIGVKNALQFCDLNDALVKKQMSVVGLRLKKDLCGIPTIQLDDVQTKKSIATTRTFDKNYSRYEDVSERVATFAVVCSEKLRKQNTCCNSVLVFLYTNRHREDQPQRYASLSVKIPFATNSAIEISKAAEIALKRIWQEGYSYKKAGVIVSDIVPENIQQTTLFKQRDERHKPLMRAVDFLNNSTGGKVKLATQDIKHTWKMKQERLSPRYTTRLEDIIIVKL